MLFSKIRQRALAGWLKKNDPVSFNNSVKVQKFLFFYDMASLNNGEEIDSSHLRGYVQGPVYSDVYGDYTHERAKFEKSCNENLNSYNEINEDRAIYVDFIVKTRTDKELSEMTHKLNLWNAKKDDIMKRKNQVDLDMNDYTKEDAAFIDRLMRLYNEEDIQKTVISMNERYFLFSNEDARNLTTEQSDVLWIISSDMETPNPIYAEIAENGALIIDD